MSTISTALRHFREPTKEQLTQIFFSLPALESGEGEDAEKSGDQDVSKMDINAVLSLGEAEDSYVGLSNGM
jgi:TBC1 domain family member 8/9